MDNETIASNLKLLRGERSITEVAKAIGITPQALSNYESGIRVPRDEIKVRIAKFYKRSVKTIFFDKITHEM